MTWILLMLLCPPGSPCRAELEAATCTTPMSWAAQVDPGYWHGVCGDERGEAVRIIGHPEPEGP